MERSRELEELIRDWFAAFSRGDGAWIRSHISLADETRLIGTAPENWQEGPRVAEFLGDAVDELGGAIEILPTADLIAVRDGPLGWGALRATLRLPDGSEAGFRWSAVFRQEEGAWKAVQIHGSLGVPDEDLLGTGG